MGKQRDFIGKYETVRYILRRMFYNGSFTADDFLKMGIKKSKFHQYYRNIKSVMNGCITEQRLENGKKMEHIENDIFASQQNNLLDIYTIKTFTEKGAFLALALMQIFGTDSDIPAEGLALSEVADKLLQTADESVQDEIEVRTLERKLKEFADYRYVATKKVKQRAMYQRAENLLNLLSDTELNQLAMTADFFQNCLHPSVCGKYLLDTVCRNQRERSLDEYRSIFLWKHMHMGQVLDDELLWDLVTAMSNHQMVSFAYQFTQEFVQIFPHKIIVDEAYGRRYLFGINLYENANTPLLYRLDKMSGLKAEACKSDMNHEIAEKYYQEGIRHSFHQNTIFFEKPKSVRLAFQKDVQEQVLKRFPDAVCTPYDAEHFETVVFVNSAKELKPWLRQFLGQIWVVESDENLEKEMQIEWMQWRKAYGID